MGLFLYCAVVVIVFGCFSAVDGSLCWLVFFISVLHVFGCFLLCWCVCGFCWLVLMCL